MRGGHEGPRIFKTCNYTKESGTTLTRYFTGVKLLVTVTGGVIMTPSLRKGSRKRTNKVFINTQNL